MRPPAHSLLALLALAAAFPAAAAEVELGWDARVGWDSNPLRVASDEEDDFSVYSGPNFGLRDRGRTLEYFLDYRLRYEQYVDRSSVNGFEHFLNGNATWRISPRSELRLSQAASRTRGLSANFLDPVPGIDPIDATAELQLRRAPTIRNNTSLAYTHNLTPLWSLESTLDGTVYDYEDELRSDVLSVRGSAQLVRPIPIGKRTVAGFGGAVTRQEFDDTERSLGSGATYFEGFGVVRYQFSPTLSLSFSGGPAWNEPDDLDEASLVAPNGVLQDANQVSRLVDPSRCTLPGTDVPAGTVAIGSCPTRSGFYNIGGVPTFLPSALITSPDARIDRTQLRFEKVDVVGDLEQPGGTVTFFGRAAINKTWRQFEGEASYQRRASTSSGLGGATDIDIAEAKLSWVPDRRRLRVDLRGTWTLQSSAFEQPFYESLLDPTPVTVYVDGDGRVFDDPGSGRTAVPNASRVVGVRSRGLVDSGLEVETFRVDLRASRRFGQHLTVEGLTGYWRQETRNDFVDPLEVDNFRIQVGFTWSLEPIDLL